MPSHSKQQARVCDYDEALLGNEADIIYAWCALALAAKEPFFSEDGPMSCYFKQPVYEETQTKVREENATKKVTSVPARTTSTAKNVSQAKSSAKSTNYAIKAAGTKVPKNDCEIDYFDRLTAYNGSAKCPQKVRQYFK